MTRLVHISDTHGQHLNLQGNIPEGDFLVHSGDFCNHGSYSDCMRFFGWLNMQPHKHKIVISGNHDLWMEKAHPLELANIVPPGVTYLHDEAIEIDGYKFWGSPYQPEFFSWAFNVPRGKLHEHWDKIPQGTDIVITHGPPEGFGDTCPDFNANGSFVSVGDKELLEALDRVKPILHLCGHVHFGYGTLQHKGTWHSNASICDESYRTVNKPNVFDIEGKEVTPVAIY